MGARRTGLDRELIPMFRFRAREIRIPASQIASGRRASGSLHATKVVTSTTPLLAYHGYCFLFLKKSQDIAENVPELKMTKRLRPLESSLV